MCEFTIPSWGITYTDIIYERSRSLIWAGIWDGIEKQKLDSWINNFTTEEERYFAACILDSLIYRSNKQIESMIKQLFNKEIHEFLLNSGIDINSMNFYKYLQKCKPENTNIRLIPIIPEENNPTKSGMHLGRTLMKSLDINSDLFLMPNTNNLEYYSNYIFIFYDDMLGSGDQFVEFYNKYNLYNINKNNHILYAPFTAHNEGILSIKDKIGFYNIVTADKIDNEYSFFNKWNCGDDNTVTTANKFYLNMLRKYNLIEMLKYPFGYNDMGLTYAFNHSCPDNCLPILWKEESNWKPLLKKH